MINAIIYRQQEAEEEEKKPLGNEWKPFMSHAQPGPSACGAALKYL